METQIAPQSRTARGPQYWFFGMLAEVKASAADTGGQYTLLEVTAPPACRPHCTSTTAKTRASTSSTGA